MATRNKLLADIVIAVGGTVRDPNNRNFLLEDWLSALTGGAFINGILQCNGILSCNEIIPCGV